MEFGTSGSVLVALAAIILGIINCFFGYRFFRFMLGVYGFLLGFGLGAALAQNLAEGNTIVLVVAGLIAGIIGALIMVFLYFVGVFIVGAVAGILLANALGSAFGWDTPLLVAVIVGILVGIVALVLQRVVLILATAFSGAWAVVSGIVALVTGQSLTLGGAFNPPDVGQWDAMALIPLVGWLVLGIVGAVFQFRTTAERARPARAAV